ncbi:hypothetical protein CLU79DRAFT_533188 [Phycomyces nitens]|nr:hypothetical protein CLU79DRAFT_533188 [Phycomyces nitens]
MPKNTDLMSSSTTRTLFCLPQSQPDDELNAFDLTWRNYLPSMTQLCPCLAIFPRRGIQLDDYDDDAGNLGPQYYNDHSIYQGQTIQGYLRNSRDREFESVLEGGGEDGIFSGGDYMPSFVTRNPFGRSKKKRSRRRKDRAHLIQEHDEPAVYEIFSEDQDRVDAESLGDDQIASLVFQRKVIHLNMRPISLTPFFLLLNDIGIRSIRRGALYYCTSRWSQGTGDASPNKIFRREQELCISDPVYKSTGGSRRV